MVQLFILDIVGVDILLFLCFDLQQFRKSSMYSELSTFKFKHFTMLFIFILNKGTGCYLVELPFLVLVVLRVLCWFVLGIFDHLRSFFYKNWQSSLHSHIFQVFDYAIFPRGIIGLFYIKKYGCHMFFFSKKFSYEGFQVDKVINCTCFSKASLTICD